MSTNISTNISTNKPEAGSQDQLGLVKLVAFSIGTTLASAIFSLSGDMAAKGANTAAVLIGWLIAGVGTLGLVMCYYGLNRARPDLTSGIYSYAKEGFGDYLGFNSAWGYWFNCVLTNVSYAALIFAAIGYFFPIFGKGNNLISIICGSALIWLCTALVLRGVKEATTLNVIVVIAKILPILVMALAIVFVKSFKVDIFMHNFWGEPGGLSFLEQLKATTPSTMWAFVGVESVVVISKRAKKSNQAGNATVISFLCLLAIYLMISLLSMGVMTREQLASLGNPPLAGIMEHVLGSFGAILANVGVIISLVGATFSYTLLYTEASYEPATQGCFPKFFAAVNKKRVPENALITSSLIIQVFLIILLVNESTYQIFYTLCTSMMLIPYLFSTLFYVKVIAKKDGNITKLAPRKLLLQKFIAALGTIYATWLLYSSGITLILISAILYAPGVIIYIWSKKEKGEKPFSKPMDIACLIVIMVMFIISVVLIANGTIHPFSF